MNVTFVDSNRTSWESCKDNIKINLKTILQNSLQGGVLSPLMWSLVVEELIWSLKDYYYYCKCTAIIINIKFPQNVSVVFETSVGIVLCDCKVSAEMRSCHLGLHQMKSGDYQSAPVNKVLHSKPGNNSW